MATKVMVSFARSDASAYSGANHPGDDPRAQAATALQNATAPSVLGTGEDNVEDLRRWREAH